MTLRVQPEAIRHYGSVLGRARDDAEICKSYFNAQVPEIAMGVDGGLINPIGYAHTGVRRELGALLDRMVSILDGSAEAISDTATTYERTDSDATQRLDQSYPAVRRPIPAVS